MDLWIRSQDKMNLVKVNKVNINYQNKKQIIANYIPDFVGTQGEYYELLGTYDSEKRAMEILNEIFNHLYISVSLKNENYYNADIDIKGDILCHMIKLYEMPMS